MSKYKAFKSKSTYTAPISSQQSFNYNAIFSNEIVAMSYILSPLYSKLEKES